MLILQQYRDTTLKWIASGAYWDSIPSRISRPCKNTTLQKFLARIKSRYIGFIFAKTLKLFYSHDDEISITAIDSSGFTSSYASHYYSERTRKIRKHFIKTSILVDTERQFIVGFISSKSRVHDTRHARLLLR